MASGALPPGFPPVEIDGHCYRSGIEERRASGYRDMLAALDAEPGLTGRPPTHAGARVHSVSKGRVVAAASPVKNRTPGTSVE